MKVEILPEPAPREREALLRALVQVEAERTEPSVYRSAWRLAALDAVGDGYWEAATRRLRRPGASRA